MNPRLVRFGRIIGVWLLLAAFVSLQNIAVGKARGRPVDWQWDVGHEFIYWLVWAAFAQLVRLACERWPLGRPGTATHVARHVALMLVLAPAQIITTYALHLAALLALGAVPPAEVNKWISAVRPGTVWGTFTGFLYYWLIVGVYHALMYWRLYRDEQRAAAALETRLAHSKLDALRAQLQPHFLFNALNAISVLTSEEPEKARRMLLRLSDLLRATLDATERDQVRLREEIELLERYLEIQRVRFEERLRVEIDVPLETKDALVPTFLLQPLVENAIQHGIERQPLGGSIAVRAERRDGRVELEVRDTGPGLPSGRIEERTGLSNTRARLAQLYGSDYTLTIQSANGGGTSVTIAIPYRCASSS